MAGTAKPGAVCLLGPTAAGKTGIAMRLAERLPVDLISVDSAQIYKGMDIGSAKPTAAELAAVPHRLIDIREPAHGYSAGEFCRDATAAIEEIVAAGRVPLLVGGTMLYFQALQQGLARLPVADPELRAELDARAAQIGWPALHAELNLLDPATAARLQPTDAQRIQRALEVCLLSGEPMSALQATTAPLLDVSYLNIGLLPADRAILHARIEARMATMLEAGLVAEVERLAATPGLSAESPALRAVGYRQFWPHVHGEISCADAQQAAIVATRRLAKRQMTWLRSWPELQVVDCLAVDCYAQVERLVTDWLDRGTGLVQELS